MANYCTPDEVKLIAVPEIEDVAETSTAAALAALIPAASRLIDKFCDRPENYFSAAAADPTERTFRGEGKPYIRVGRYVEADGLEFISPIVAASNFYLMPNGWPRWKDYPSNDQPDYWPINSDAFFSAGQVYTIAARWGYAATPADITVAAALITGKMHDLGKGVIGEVSPAGFVIERDIPPTARLLLEGHKRREFEIN